LPNPFPKVPYHKSSLNLRPLPTLARPAISSYKGELLNSRGRILTDEACKEGDVVEFMHFIPLYIRPGQQGNADRSARCKKPKNLKKRYSLFVIRYWLKDQSRIKSNRASGPRGASRQERDLRPKQ